MHSTNDSWPMFFATSPDGSMLVTWEAPPKEKPGTGRASTGLLSPLADSQAGAGNAVAESRVRKINVWSLDRNMSMVPVASLESCAQVHCAAIATDNTWLAVGAGIKYGTRKSR